MLQCSTEQDGGGVLVRYPHTHTPDCRIPEDSNLMSATCFSDTSVCSLYIPTMLQAVASQEIIIFLFSRTSSVLGVGKVTNIKNLRKHEDDFWNNV